MKLCDVCEKPYEFALRIKYETGGKSCTHDLDVGTVKYDLTYMKRQRAENYVDLMQPADSRGVPNRNFFKKYGIPKGIDPKWTGL